MRQSLVSFRRVPFMRNVIVRSLLLAPFLALLAGCAGIGAPAPQRVLPMPEPGAAVRTIRAADDGLDSAVQIAPLRDAAIDGFLADARAAEAGGRLDAAVGAVERALELAPDAPDILQFRAELDVARGDWLAAERRAVQSFKLGPKVGGLCARNWQTLIQARIALDDPPTVAQARQRLAECRVKPRVRM